jgi:hypothetical protein
MVSRRRRRRRRRAGRDVTVGATENDYLEKQHTAMPAYAGSAVE